MADVLYPVLLLDRLPEESGAIPGFFIHPCIASEAAEVQFLQQASDVSENCLFENPFVFQNIPFFF